ncbi:restriction endonuclease subunit S [Enterococcus faecalis]|uniref:restriction endonuclease subunit S n=2 Tax=Enterococcus faecalis TaxID=1351 RepID=UPI00115A432E|nr:restriction endonuclease subunit S [Enterococcus faecalis]EGO2725713.1 restriction endonuclease subunit S [Enterococcus faecalis]EGO6768778.1 restriction endonuclease subunit S [Enterococcus faecalis]EGO9213155.1 restriction endonuclease subunit S [Enterococcus faecalis]HAP3814789.1 restriction endonuclease subunit S [Enterococcus faecalis]
MKKVPRLRFRGFQEDWELCKVGDFGREIYGGGTPKTSVKEFWSGTLPWIQSSDLKEDKVCDIKAKKHISVKAIQQSSAKKISKNSIAIVTRVSVGKLVLMPYEYATSQDFLSISVLQVDKWFGVYSLYNKLQSELNSVQGTSIKGITKDELLNKKIMIPKPLKEQSKIGLFLKKIDTTIALHQRKLDQLKELKTAYLQVIFPVKDERVPKLRFADFEEEWELCKLGDLANIVGGGTPNTNNPKCWDGNIDWYAPAEIKEKIYVTGSKKRITELGLQKSSAKVLPIGTVLFTSRAGIGNTAILAKKGTTNQGFQSIIPNKNKLDTYFIFSRTHELKKYGEAVGAGSTFVEVSGKQMAKMPMLTPRFNEQQAIGMFFKKIDDIITLHQNKLEQLKDLKTSYLQNMFI